MDRIAPTRRPNRKIVGYQQWRELLFLHWPVEENDLRALVPDCLSIDTYDGQAYVGLVPFAMLGVRPWWWPRALAFSFLETNLRTYVHVRGQHPGVYFFSLDAASWLAVKAARLGWGLPYFHARMKQVRDGAMLTYQSRRRVGYFAPVDVTCRITDELGPSQPDTLDHFLFERYLLHVVRKGALYTGQVHHRPYPVWRADVEHCEQGLVSAAGLPMIDSVPPLAHYSSGVDVEIFRLQEQALGVRA